MATLMTDDGHTVTIDSQDEALANLYQWTTRKLGDGKRHVVATQGKDPIEFILTNTNYYKGSRRVTHKNGDTFDNRRRNLHVKPPRTPVGRVKGSQEIARKYRGVTWLPKRQCYVARIIRGGKAQHLGYFEDPKEAALAYIKRAQEIDAAELAELESNDSATGVPKKLTLLEYNNWCKGHGLRPKENTLDDAENAALGFLGELGEVADILKKAKFYPNYRFKRRKFLLELGDLLFYAVWCADLYGDFFSDTFTLSATTRMDDPLRDLALDAATILSTARTNLFVKPRIFAAIHQLARCHAGSDINRVMQMNIRKLIKRYPDGFPGVKQ